MDLSVMVTDKGVEEAFSKYQEKATKHIFLWALGKSAIKNFKP